MKELKVVTVSLSVIEALINNGNQFVLEQVSKQLGETNKQEKEILTRKAAAELLDISYTCMYDWIDSGCLKPYKMGNRTYFKYSEVMETLFNSNKAG